MFAVAPSRPPSDPELHLAPSFLCANVTWQTFAASTSPLPSLSRVRLLLDRESWQWGTPPICPGRYLLLATTGSIDLMTLMGRHSPWPPYYIAPLDALFIDLTLQYRWHILSLFGDAFSFLFGALNAFLYP